MMKSFFIPFALALARIACAIVPETLQDGDDLNSGYNPDHSIDPEFIKSDQFGIQWTFRPTENNATERFMAKPLVYTDDATGKQVLIVAASSNRVYVLDAETGTLLNSRQLRKPYLEPGLPCGDLIPETGVLGTPVIDKETGTLYLFAKGYPSNQTTGPFNSGYFLHAIDALALTERDNFPVHVDGPASNDPVRYFNAGLHLQRPSLKLLNGVVYGGFGGGCGSFNQTGWLSGVNVKTGSLATLLATQTGPAAPSVEGGFYAGGGGGSVWQAGVGFASDREDRFFLVTGDGHAFNASFPPAAGNEPGQILEGSVLNMKVNSDGSITPQDHFRPANYGTLGSSSRDLGSGGLTLLDPKHFSVPGAERLALAGGNNGVVYLLNLDDLGGYRQGADGGNKVVQTWPVPGNSPGLIYGSFGVYPLEGGYIYIKPVGLRSVLVYKFGEGPEYFKLVAQSEESATTAVGSGSPVVTTFGGKDGTAIVWVADINTGLTAYHAIPQNGTLISIKIPQIGRPKFQRPVFGENRVYIVTTDGYVVAYGK